VVPIGRRSLLVLEFVGDRQGHGAR
jgi:hypothetical protein